MSFALIAFVCFAIPVWLVKRGYNRVKVGAGALAAFLTPSIVFVIFPRLETGLIALFSIPFILIATIWLLVSALADRKTSA